MTTTPIHLEHAGIHYQGRAVKDQRWAAVHTDMWGVGITRYGITTIHGDDSALMEHDEDRPDRIDAIARTYCRAAALCAVLWHLRDIYEETAS